MIQHIVDKQWIALALLLVLSLLYLGVACRVRHEKKLKDRLALDRGDAPPAEAGQRHNRG